MLWMGPQWRSKAAEVLTRKTVSLQSWTTLIESPKSLLPLHAPLHWHCIWDPKQKTAHFTNAKKQMTTILSFRYYLHFNPWLLYTDLLILYNTDFPREIMLIRISERFTNDPIFTFALTKGGCHQRAATAFSLDYESSTSAVQIYSHWNVFLAGITIYLGSPFPHSWKGNCNLILGVSRKQKPLYLYPVKTFQIKCMTWIWKKMFMSSRSNKTKISKFKKHQTHWLEGKPTEVKYHQGTKTQ